MSKITEKVNLKETTKESLSIELTNRCNSACSHCFVRAAIPNYSDLPVEVVKDIITEGYQLGFRRLHFTGGEPLLWEGLFEALDYAFFLDYQSIFINTNGTLLTKDVCKRLRKYNGLVLSVSVQGSENKHDLIRGEGSYKRTLKGIERLLEVGIDAVIFTTVGKTLIADLPYYTEELYRRFPDIKCLSFIQMIRVTGDVFDLSSELLNPNDFMTLVRIVSLLNIYGHKTEILNNPLAIVVSRLLKITCIPQVLPLHRPAHLIIMASGHLTASHSTWTSFGKYKPGMIEKVLSSKEYRLAVSPDETTCSSCVYTKLCKESGMFRPSEWYRDMNPNIPYCKRVLNRAARWHLM